MGGKIARFRNYSGIIMAAICVAALFGCGGGGGGPAPVPPPSGKVVQGAVSGAIVFADHQTSPEANYKMDADEADTATTTASDGNFTLPVRPGYDYVSVSAGGIDTITGKPAIQMLAPAGVGVISPLTTMVVMEPATESVIKSLGIDYKTDISQQVTPAALLVIQSLQAIVAALTGAVNPGNNTLKYDQVHAIQRTVLEKIAAEIKNKTAAELTDPATLTATLQTAVKSALDAIAADPAHSNVGIPDTENLANTVVTGALINTVAASIDPTGTFSTDPRDAKKEDEIITQADAESINAATDDASEAAAAQVTVTSKPNHTPTISGVPANRAAVGESYSFKPTAGDEDNDSLTFIVVNKPAWVTFNTATGELKGMPASADVGVASNIVISVSDGVATASLPPFSMIVYKPTGGTGGGGGF